MSSRDRFGLPGRCRGIEVGEALQGYSHFPMETYGVIASYDPAARLLTLWANFQGPFIIHTVIARALRMPQDRVRVIVPGDIGGGFGLKTSMYPYMVLLGLAAMKAGVPVKWIEKNRATFWDTVRRDTDGIYWFVGRSDDMLKVGGAMVSPIEIENVLVEHPAVLEAAVVGAPDEHGLIKPKALLVLKQGFRPSPELEVELTTLVKARLARYKYPRWYVYVDQLPKTATGKIQRFKLREAG